MGNLPQIGVKINNVSNHHLDNTPWKMNMLNPRMEVWFTWFSISIGWFWGCSRQFSGVYQGLSKPTLFYQATSSGDTLTLLQKMFGTFGEHLEYFTVQTLPEFTAEPQDEDWQNMMSYRPSLINFSHHYEWLQESPFLLLSTILSIHWLDFK